MTDDVAIEDEDEPLKHVLTVAELIAALSTFDPSMRVWADGDGSMAAVIEVIAHPHSVGRVELLVERHWHDDYF